MLFLGLGLWILSVLPYSARVQALRLGGVLPDPFTDPARNPAWIEGRALEGFSDPFLLAWSNGVLMGGTLRRETLTNPAQGVTSFSGSQAFLAGLRLPLAKPIGLMVQVQESSQELQRTEETSERVYDETSKSNSRIREIRIGGKDPHSDWVLVLQRNTNSQNVHALRTLRPPSADTSFLLRDFQGKEKHLLIRLRVRRFGRERLLFGQLQLFRKTKDMQMLWREVWGSEDSVHLDLSLQRQSTGVALSGGRINVLTKGKDFRVYTGIWADIQGGWKRVHMPDGQVLQGVFGAYTLFFPFSLERSLGPGNFFIGALFIVWGEWDDVGEPSISKDSPIYGLRRETRLWKTALESRPYIGYAWQITRHLSLAYTQRLSLRILDPTFRLQIVYRS